MGLALGFIVAAFGAFLLWLGYKGYSFAKGFEQLGLGKKGGS